MWGSRRWPKLTCSSVIACRSMRGSGVSSNAAGALPGFLAGLAAQFPPPDREFAQRLLLGGEGGPDLGPQDLLVEQVLDPDPEAQRLVGVAGPDPAPGGADRELPELDLSGGVEEHVVGHDQVRVGGHLEVADVDPAPLQPVDLFEQDGGVEHHPVADHAGLLGVEDPGGDQVELELLAVADDRVAGVVAALEADDHLGALGEQVRDLALPLVAPLGPDYDYSWHNERGIVPGIRRPCRSAGRRRTGAPRRTSASGGKRCGRRSGSRAPRGGGWSSPGPSAGPRSAR